MQIEHPAAAVYSKQIVSVEQQLSCSQPALSSLAPFADAANLPIILGSDADRDKPQRDTVAVSSANSGGAADTGEYVQGYV